MDKSYKTPILITLLLLTTGFYFYRYQSYKNENLALKVKVKLLSKNKKKSLTWAALKELESKKLSEPKVPDSNTTQPEAGSVVLVKKVEEADKLVAPQDVETDLLITEIESKLKNRKDLKLVELDQALLAADELISRNPNVYSSYKAKLILLLTKELAYNANINDDEVALLLDTMSEFDVLSDRTLRKEAFLIATTDAKIDELVEEVEALENDLIYAERDEDARLLDASIAMKLAEIDSMEDQLEEGLLDEEDYLNQDLVEIPLLRALAKSDFETVIESSENLLNNYPGSVRGYFFLVRALELSGRKEEAFSVIANNDLDQYELEQLQSRLSRTQGQNPQDYWKSLRF
jgi:hypothetical protein